MAANADPWDGSYPGNVARDPFTGVQIRIGVMGSAGGDVETVQAPYEEYDVLVFTGLGLMGRELVNIHSSDIVVVVSGRSGTLGEFAIAYEEGKLIGALTDTGGITTCTRSPGP